MRTVLMCQTVGDVHHDITVDVGRLRKVFMEGAHLASIGEEYDLTYPTEHLGEGAEALTKVLKGAPILKRLQEAKYPAIIVGPGLLNRLDRAAVLQQVIIIALPEAFLRL